SADIVVLDVNRAVLADVGSQPFLVAHATHERARAPIYEPLSQLFVQGVGQGIFDLARTPLPMLRITQPVGAVGYEGPGPNVRNAVGERIDVAVRAIGERNLAGEPVLRDALLVRHQELE